MNHADETPATFLAKVQALADAFLAVYFGVPIGVVTQNPRYAAPDGAPASRIPDHQARQIALRQYARTKGWWLVDHFSQFVKQPDQGASWVEPSDGKHPNTQGRAAIAATMKAALQRLSTR